MPRATAMLPNDPKRRRWPRDTTATPSVFTAGWPHRNAQCRMALADLAERFYLQNDLTPDSVRQYELERNRIIRKHELTDQ